jgi:succinate dehydrogenase / fumarate reductase membrane anchor subunit
MQTNRYQTPLARARGLGSARQGPHHWWRQRVTSVALLPLTPWLAYSMAQMSHAEYAQVVAWIAAPWNTVLLLSFLFLAVYHGMLGVQVVLEDYVHSDWQKILAILIVKLSLAFLGLSAAFAILRIVFLSHG